MGRLSSPRSSLELRWRARWTAALSLATVNPYSDPQKPSAASSCPYWQRPSARRLMGLGWEVGILVATFAMAGDLFSSFVKRRLHLPSSSMAIGLDHIPESLFPLLASRWLLPLSTLDIVVGVTIFVVGALILSPLLFKLNLRDEPH